jgi:hypothetical protein
LAWYEGSLGSLGGSALINIFKDGRGYEVVREPSAVDWFGMEKPFAGFYNSPFSEEETDGYYIFSDEAAQLTEVLSAQDLTALGLPDGEYYGEEDFAAIQSIEYVDGDIFFTLATGTRNSAKDVGWRYGYDRSKTDVYRKDLSTGEIILLFTY